MVKYLVWLFVVAALLLFFVLPMVTNYAIKKDFSVIVMSRWLNTLQRLQTFMMQLFVYVWVAFFGACLASFLNVVAWRVPRGRSILGSSHCPHCEVRLSMKDNIPVFGWLNSNGQCRNCGVPIAVRYLVVELLLGLVFVLLFTIEVAWGGANLPLPPDVQRTGIEFLVFTPNVPLLSTFLYHAALMCGLFTIAVIASEKKTIPILVIIFAAIIPLAIASSYPNVLQVPWTALVRPVHDWPLEQYSRLALETMGIGAAAGTLMGLLLFGVDFVFSYAARNQSNSQAASNRLPVLSAIVAGAMLVGMTLGWQSAVCVFVLWCICKPVLMFISPAPFRETISSAAVVLMFATILHIVFWKLQMPANLWLTTFINE